MEKKPTFSLKVDATLLKMLECAGINHVDAVLFLSERVKEMMNTTPNYGKHMSNPARTYQMDKIWLMRGFFPKTPIMFKISMFTKKEFFTFDDGSDFIAFAKIPTIKPSRKHLTYLMVDSEKNLIQIANEKMDEILLDDTCNKSLLPKNYRKPKCFSPKGCKIYKLNMRGK